MAALVPFVLMDTVGLTPTQFGLAMLAQIGAFTAGALASFASIAGAASALTGFLQVGGGLASTAVAALVFRDPFLVLTIVMPGMAALATLVYVGLAARSGVDLIY